MKKVGASLSLLLLTLCSMNAVCQPVFNHDDTLRGSLNAQRDWFDIQRYDIHVTPNYAQKSITGMVQWTAKVKKPAQNIQIDLQQPLFIDSITYVGSKNGATQSLSFIRNNNVAIVNFTAQLNLQSNFSLFIYYHGVPREAIRPPWDGGWIWKKDANGKPWMSVACQGLGASVWYPCKDHQSDEPDLGASLTMNIPDTLNAISNGRMIKKINQGHITSYTWEVKNPINNYNIIPYIGDYVGWNEKYPGLKGDLDVHYWILREDSLKARKQFTQVPQMLKAFEYWMGPYPFYEDGYQLVQSPHLGMEHQSAVAYGNKFMNGYLGRDLSGTGWGDKWDFIIVHESGHEWFANNITTQDIADMWVHEGFTNYSETLMTDYYFGVEAGNDYNFGIRKNIRNDKPVIGHYGVNEEGSGDMYYKGSNMIHTIRHSINNDSLFRQIIMGLNKTFYHKTVTTQDIENYISMQAGFNYKKIYDQYLRTAQIPELIFEYDAKEKILTYQWKNCEVGFNLPLSFKYRDKKYNLSPIDYIPQKKLITQDNFDLKEFTKLINRLYYVKVVSE
ncbi:MAG: M1 family metallopeptidase [Chitinophagaceae bacterium]